MKKSRKKERIYALLNTIDNNYGKGKINLKDAIISLITLIVLFLFMEFMLYQFSRYSFEFWMFLYCCVIILSEILMFLATLSYDNPKKSDTNKTIKKIIFIITSGFFFLSILPVNILFVFFNFAIRLLGIEIIAKNIGKEALNVVLYFVALVSCIILYDNVKDMNFIQYISFVGFIYLISFEVRNIIDKKAIYDSYQDKYEYLYITRKITHYFVIFLTVLSGVGGLYISKSNNEFMATNIYLVMPLVIFAGCDQVVLISRQYKSDKHKFLLKLYNELIIIKNIAYPQIKYFSCTKIKIKITITPWAINNYINYLHFQNCKSQKMKFNRKKNSKIQFANNTLKQCENMLSREYAVYLDEEKIVFEQELSSNIENLAKCLTDLI